jgi:hypothetical protein
MANHEHQRNRDILSSENRSREEIIRILVQVCFETLERLVYSTARVLPSFQDLVNTATEAKTFYQNLSRVEQRIVPLREVQSFMKCFNSNGRFQFVAHLSQLIQCPVCLDSMTHPVM